MVSPAVDPTSSIHGLAERWVALERVPGDRLEVASRLGQILIAGRSNLALVKPTGEVGWRRVFGGRAVISSAAIDPHGGHVAVVLEGPRLELIRGSQGESVASTKLTETSTCVAVAERGQRIVVGDRFGTLRYLDPTGTTKGTVEVGHPIDRVGVSPRGEQAVVASATGHISLIGPKYKVERSTFVRSQVERVWMDGGGDRAFVLAAGEGVMVQSFRSTSMITLGLDRPVLDADSNSAGDLVLLLTHDRSLAILDSAARVVWQGEAPAGAQRLRGNHDLSRVWLHDAEGQLHSFDLLRGAEGARRAASLSKGPRQAYAREVVTRALPAPGGFKRIHLDPDAGTGRIALEHPNGTVVVLTAEGRELRRVDVSGGLKIVRFTDRGGYLGVASEKGVAMLDPHVGWRATAALASPILGLAHGTAALIAGSADGNLSLLQPDGARPFVAVRAPISDLAATRTMHGCFVFAALASGEVRGYRPDGTEAFSLEGGPAVAPVRLAAIGDRVLVGTASGRLKLLGLTGDLLGEAKVGLPVIDVKAVGDGFVVVDSRGELHRWTHTLDRGEGRQPPPGSYAAAVGPDGPACLVHYDRETLTVQSWGRRELARFEISGGLIDLAATSHARWALLMQDAFVLPQPATPRRE